MYMALENSALRSFGDKVALVFSDATGAVFRDMIEDGLKDIQEIVLSETGLNVQLTVKMESDFDTNSSQGEDDDPFNEIASLPWVNS